MQTVKFSVIKTKKIGKNCKIDPFCLIEENVTIGDNVIIHSGSKIENNVVIGDNVEIFPNSYVGKRPKNPGCLSRELSFVENTVIGENTMIGPNATIYIDVSIGKNCLIGDGSSIREQVKIGNFSVIGRNSTVNYNTVIGDNVKIMDLTVITGNCTIGNDVFISCLVATTNDKKIGKSKEFNDKNIKGPVIHDNVAIGAGANILHETTIGSGSIVAAGSIVTKDIPNKVLVMGTPAKIIKNIE
jgi:acetyltransferase-like isoleucine patch superfamily enzyme